MKNRILLFTSLLLVFTFSYGQDTSKTEIIIYGSNGGYKINGKKVRNLKPYLMQYSESAVEYKAFKKTFAIELSTLGLEMASLSTMLLSKNPKTVETIAYISIPVVGINIYHLFKGRKQIRKSIDAYNRRLTAYQINFSSATEDVNNYSLSQKKIN